MAVKMLLKNWFPILADNYLKIIISFLYISIFLTGFFENPVINNGDYPRITDILKIDVPFKKALYNDVYTITNFSTHVKHSPSTLRFITFVVYKISYLFEHKTVNLYYLRFVLYMIYIAGIYMIMRSEKKTTTIFVMLPVTLIVFPLLNSLYEEAAVCVFTPWLIYSIIKKQRFLYLLFSLLIVLAKPQMIALVPFLTLGLYTVTRRWRSVFPFAALVLLPSLYQINNRNEGLVNPNKYHRFYNSIGYSAQNVSEWPVFDFTQRMLYFNRNRKALQKKSDQYFNPRFSVLAGTTYWPEEAVITEADARLRKEIFYQTSKSNFVRTVLQHPDLIIKISRESILTAFKANYSLSYLITKRSHNLVIKARNICAKFFYPLLLLFSATVAIRKPLKYSVITCGLTLLAAVLIFPVIVVIGDGYFEFEKHLVPYLATVPALIKIAENFIATQHFDKSNI